MRPWSFLAALVLVGLPAAAGAQDRVGVTIQAGAIAGDDAAPLDSFSRPVVTASIQHVFARHFVIEGEASYWRLERSIERGPHNIETAQGVIGTVAGTRVVDSHAYFNYGVNALIKSTGPVRVFGGAGVGLSSDQNEYRQQSFGCSPSLDPRVCEEFVNDRGRGPIFMVRALGGIEVPITGVVEVVGTIRAEKTAWEDRSHWLSATAGVRFSFE
jgi:hypothetical protein